TANYRNLKAGRGAVQSPIKFLDPEDLSFPFDRQCDEGKFWDAGHCGEAAQRSHHCLPTDSAAVRIRPEMDIFHDTVRFQQKQILRRPKTNDGTIIARAGNDTRVGLEVRQNFCEQLVFAELIQSHYSTISGNARAVSVSALKIACIVIETSNDPLHS